MTTINAEKFKEKADSGNYIILDVRTPEEYNTGHIENAELFDVYDPNIMKRLEALDREKSYLVYCFSASRSAGVLEMMESLGFKTVFELEMGLMGWKRSGYPVVK